MLLVLIFMIGYVEGNSLNCIHIQIVDNCLRPGMLIKDCSCGCLKMEVNTFSRNYVQADFASCAKFTRSCEFYRLGFELVIFEEKNYIPVAIKEFWINFTEHLSIQRFPLIKSTIDTELRANLSYRLSVRPVCTICEHCRHLKDLVIEPLNFHMSEAVPASTSEKKERDPKTYELVLLIIAISVCVITVAVTVTVFYRRHKIQNSSNQRQYEDNSLMNNVPGNSCRNFI